MKRINIIISFLNEVHGVDRLFRRLLGAVAPLPYIFRFIFIDDGSSDGTLEKLREYDMEGHEKIVLKLSRNWGHQNAYNAGLDHVDGDAVIFMDGDCEDPPEVVPQLIEQWEAGFDVVSAVKASREGNFFRLACFKIFYWLLNRISTVKVQSQAGMFFLADKVALDAFKRCNEKNKYYPGLRSFIGFRQTEVLYDREARYDGKSRQGFRRLTSLALNAFFSFSFLPIRILTYLGVFMLLVILGFSIFLVILKTFNLTAFGLDPVLGWTSIVLSIFFVMAIQIIFLGIIGEYIARIYDEVRERPYYIVSDIFEDCGNAMKPKDERKSDEKQLPCLQGNARNPH